MRYLLVFSIMLSATVAYAQKFSLQGELVDTTDIPLPSATVLLLSAEDSSLVNFAVSKADGKFEIKNISKGEYLFKVTFVGFRNYIQKIAAPVTGTSVDLGTVRLQPVSSELEAIEIQAERVPVTVRRDTIEFNAGSFKTKQNAVVEDLLKKLPGVEVSSDGTITAQGEQVRRVTVDGKNFFGSDPKLATRNLPADAVEKVQVFDKKSDQTTFTGVDDGQKEKTINIALKEEKKNGAFGSIMGGTGTNDRFTGRASLNRFSKARQLSFLGMGNNTNEQGFSMEDYMNFTGGSQQMMSGGAVRLEFGGDNQNGVPLNFGNRANGIMTNYASGINFNNEFSKKTEANGSYFFNYLDHNLNRSTLRENFLPAGNFNFNENSRQHNINKNHRANFTLDQKIDSLNSLKFTGNMSFNETESEVHSTSATLLSDGSIRNSNERLNISSGTTKALNSTLLWRHKFSKKGRNVSTNFQLGLSQIDRGGILKASNHFFKPKDSISVVNQSNQQSTDYKSYSGTLSYTEPLGKRRYLEGNYNYRENLNDVNREVYDVNNGEPFFNSKLSNQYSSDYQYHRTGLNFRLVRSNYNFALGGSLQQTNLHGELKSTGAIISKTFQNVLPVMRFNYDLSATRHLNFDYETSVQEPGIQQLQPVVDNSDPLNIYVGNPKLRPAYQQSGRFNFTSFDPATFVNFFSFVDVDYTTNAIVNSQSVNQQLIRITKPVNVSNSLSVNGDANFGFPINKIGSRFSFGANYRVQRSLALLNDMENQINQQTVGGNFRYTYRYKEIFETNLIADIDRQTTNYQFNQPDQQFINQTYTAESNLSFLKNYQFSSNFEYLVYNNKSTNFIQKIPLLNLSISRFVLKNKAGELKISVNNLLNKALGISQSFNVNYLERQTTNSLGRYFLLTFTYALNKQLNPMGMRRGGGMMRIIR
jgi:hypothetical protein